MHKSSRINDRDNSVDGINLCHYAPGLGRITLHAPAKYSASSRDERVARVVWLTGSLPIAASLAGIGWRELNPLLPTRRRNLSPVAPITEMMTIMDSLVCDDDHCRM
jgi:hypothetical protein